ncbi:hypothetical protein GCM10027422_42320 [Hymenobacter arcticus]
MEARAPYQSAAPKGPRNLTQGLGEWLRAQGFSASEQRQPTFCLLTAHWTSPRFERFELTYSWKVGPNPDANCQLRVLSHQLGPQVEVLFTSQRVRRLKEVRLLLLGNVRYHNARLLARPAATPATS